MDTKFVQDNMVIFLDTLGRLIIGIEVKEKSNDELLFVQNPVIVHTETKNGNLLLQFFPVFFKEFIADKTESIVFSYNRKNISLASSIVLDFKFYAQYFNMFYNQPSNTDPWGGKSKPTDNNSESGQTEKSEKPIKLFEE